MIKIGQHIERATYTTGAQLLVAAVLVAANAVTYILIITTDVDEACHLLVIACLTNPLETGSNLTNCGRCVDAVGVLAAATSVEVEGLERIEGQAR